MMQEAFGAYRAVVADLGEQEKADAWGEVYGCIKGFEKGDGIETEFEVIIGSGSRSLKGNRIDFAEPISRSLNLT